MSDVGPTTMGHLRPLCSFLFVDPVVCSPMQTVILNYGFKFLRSMCLGSKDWVSSLIFTQVKSWADIRFQMSILMEIHKIVTKNALESTQNTALFLFSSQEWPLLLFN